MNKNVKIYYEDVDVAAEGGLKSELKSAFIPFSDSTTPYLESMSYKDNFDKFVQDTIECGFIHLTSDEAISIFQIKKYVVHNPCNPPKNPKRKRARKRKPSRKQVSKKSTAKKSLNDPIRDKV